MTINDDNSKTEKIGNLGDLLANATNSWWGIVGSVTLLDNVIEPLLPGNVRDYEPINTKMGNIGNWMGLGAAVVTLGGLAYVGYRAYNTIKE